MRRTIMERTEKSKSKVLKLVTSQPFILFVFIILVAVVTNMQNSKFLTYTTIKSILGQAAGLGLVSAGATILVISGHFDISTGRMVGLAMSAMALMLNGGMNPVLASICGVLICVTCSVFNGIVTIAFNAPSFVVTLATQNIYYSIALLITNGYMQTMYGKYRTLSSYNIFGFFPLIYLILLLGFVFIFVSIFTLLPAVNAFYSLKHLCDKQYQLCYCHIQDKREHFGLIAVSLNRSHYWLSDMIPHYL